MPLDSDNIKEQILRAFARSLRYLSFRARSEKEMNDYLTKKEFDPLIIVEVINRLKEENLINDTDFATQWTEQRQNVKGKSKFAIKLELSQKGIDASIIEKVLNESENDFETAQKLWEKKQKRFEMFTGDEYYKKAASFLQRKGYSYKIIKKVLKNETD